MKLNLKQHVIKILILILTIAPILAGVFAVEQQTWKEYKDFIASETSKINESNGAYALDASFYVGAKAIFNHGVWDSFPFYSVIDGQMKKGTQWPSGSSFKDSNGNSYVVKVTDYYTDDSVGTLFKIEPEEGYTFPDSIADYPYIQQYYTVAEQPSLIFLPSQGMFVGNDDFVLFGDQAVATNTSIVIPKSMLPDFIDVTYVDGTIGTEFYIVDNTFFNETFLQEALGENYDLTIDYSIYKYVVSTNIQMIPEEVTLAYTQILQTSTADSYFEVVDLIPEAVRSEFTEKHNQNIEAHLNALLSEDVRNAYDSLLNAESSSEYYSILNEIGEELYNQFPNKYKENVEVHLNELIRIENIEYKDTVTINGKEVEVSVKGRIPEEDITLSVESVSDEVTMNQGFDITNPEDIILSLDIKLIKGDGTVWQPNENDRIAISIDMTSLGYKDGDVFKFHHNHEGTVYEYDIFVVMNGSLTYYTNVFSIYTVSTINSDQYDGVIKPDRVGTATNPEKITLVVGKEYIFYSDAKITTTTNGGWPNYRPIEQTNPPVLATFAVTDKSGAIYYTVHTASNVGNEGVYAPWIKIVALKETTDDQLVDLVFKYTANRNDNTQVYTENYQIEIVKPKATTDDNKMLYIKDDVNNSGRIIAALVDENGNEILDGLDGAAFTWTRDDNAFIIPYAYGDDNRSINIARDHGGLVEARKKDGLYNPVKYTVTATLSNGSTKTASYTVYYQSEIINADFENPVAPERNYSFYINGWPDLYWKTTAPGDHQHLTKDVEYASYRNGQPTSTGFGVRNPADASTGGYQFAELNAEAFGSLYQDIITVPGEDIEWEFSHAPRQDQQTWASDISNAMFIIFGPTEAAQELTEQSELEALYNIALGKVTNANHDAFYAGDLCIEVEYDGAEYAVWYHDAPTIGANDNTTANQVYGQNDGWTKIEGTYQVPEEVEGTAAQYRTRIFFVSHRKLNDRGQQISNAPNAGNLIDISKVGQYKSYLIEYYEETFDNQGVKKTTFKGEKNSDGTPVFTQSGEKILYSFVDLTGLSKLITEASDYLHKIMINGQNYPYEVREPESATIYIDKYSKPDDYTYRVTNATYPNDYNPNYNNYDIIVQVFVRDTVVAVENEIIFPYKTEYVDGKPVDKDLLTIEQKLEILEGLVDSDTQGYKSKFNLLQAQSVETVVVDGVSKNKLVNPTVFANEYMVIQNVSPTGNYIAYMAPDSNPPISKEGNRYYYSVQEIFDENSTQSIPGLELKEVRLTVSLFKYGSEEIVTLETITVDGNSKDFTSAVFELNDNYKIAEIKVDNVYVEKKTTITYEAIGNGKVKFNADGFDFEDKPTEKIDFYSGKAIGAVASAGADARFEGWYRELGDDEIPPDETKVITKVTSKGNTVRLVPVISADGVWDKDDPTHFFKPNANIINADTINFYAVFDTRTVSIEKIGGIPNQPYIYRVTGKNDGEVLFDIHVSLKCNSTGYGKREIFEVEAKEITVTEVTDWTWRSDSYLDEGDSYRKEFTGDNTLLEFKFYGGLKSDKKTWLNKYTNVITNMFGGSQ